MHQFNVNINPFICGAFILDVSFKIRFMCVMSLSMLKVSVIVLVPRFQLRGVSAKDLG